MIRDPHARLRALEGMRPDRYMRTLAGLGATNAFGGDDDAPDPYAGKKWGTAEEGSGMSKEDYAKASAEQKARMIQVERVRKRYGSKLPPQGPAGEPVDRYGWPVGQLRQCADPAMDSPKYGRCYGAERTRAVEDDGRIKVIYEQCTLENGKGPAAYNLRKDDWLNPFGCTGVWKKKSVMQWSDDGTHWEGEGWDFWREIGGWIREHDPVVQLVANLVEGKSFDEAAKAAGNAIKTTTREFGPIVQTVLSFVPGVGTGISSALGAAIALANDEPITSAFMAAARGVLPGGALVNAAWDAGLSACDAAARGKSWDAIALNTIRKALPGGPAAQAAFDGAVALATAAFIQQGNKSAKAFAEQQGTPPAPEWVATSKSPEVQEIKTQIQATIPTPAEVAQTEAAKLLSKASPILAAAQAARAELVDLDKERARRAAVLRQQRANAEAAAARGRTVALLAGGAALALVLAAR